MSDGIPYGDIIVFAAIAAFILLRYRSILGEKTGFDPTQKPKAEPKAATKEERVVPIHPRKMEEKKAEPSVDKAYEALSDTQRSGVDAIKGADASFTADNFMVGANMAFEMVLDAFHKGDEGTLKMLLSSSLYEEFAAALKDRDEGEGAVTLVSVKRAEIVEAELNKQVAQVTVEFVSEQIIAPNTHIEEVEDEWVFERDTRSKNPNWTIIDT